MAFDFLKNKQHGGFIMHSANLGEYITDNGIYFTNIAPGLTVDALNARLQSSLLIGNHKLVINTNLMFGGFNNLPNRFWRFWHRFLLGWKWE